VAKKKQKFFHAEVCRCGHRASCLTFSKIVKSRKKCKGKAIPVEDWTDPEGSRRLRFPDFMTIGT